MDADLYDHLSATITSDPHQDDSDGTEIEKLERPEGQGLSDSGPVSNNDDNRRRKRTMSSSLPQEIDQVVHAISSSQWAAQLGALMGSVKKQGESVFETTRERATREFDHVRSGLATLASLQISPTAESPQLHDSANSNDQTSSVRTQEPTSPSHTTGSMFSYLKSAADAAQKRITPTLKELSKAEDAADAYLNKLGASFGQLLKDAVTIAPPEESVSLNEKEGDILFDTSLEKKRQIHTSRIDALLHELHTNPGLVHNNPQEPSFISWQTTFSAEQYTDEIAALLNRYPELRSQMNSLVPEKISYQEFWMRYLYHKSKIETDETKRKQLFEDNEDDNGFDWDGDDEVDEAQQTDAHPGLSRTGETSTATGTPSMPISHQPSEPTTRNSCASESSTSFDIVSQSSAIPPIMRDKISHTAEESDDDWE